MDDLLGAPLTYHQARRQDDWLNPELDTWLARLEQTIAQVYLTNRKPIVLVGHSMGALLTSFYCNRIESDSPVKAAMLVAPADLHSENYPEAAVGFEANPFLPIEIPSILVTSSNDSYCDTDSALQMAEDWQIELADIGNADHLNSASGLEDWSAGLEMLKGLIEKII